MPSFYGSIDAADAYHAARGNTSWAEASEPDKQAALVRASWYVDGMVGLPVPNTKGCVYLFPGRKVASDQALQWPRSGAVDRMGEPVPADSVPRAVEYATYEGALRELAAPGSLNPDFVATQVVKREKVGPLEQEFAVSADGSNARPVIGVIDALLYPLLVRRCPGIGVRVV